MSNPFFFLIVTAPFCLKLYQEILQSPNGVLVWSFLKPILHGKILYTPNTPEINQVIQKVSPNEWGSFRPYSNRLGWKLLKHLALLQYALDYIKCSYTDYNLFGPGCFSCHCAIWICGSLSSGTLWRQKVLFGVANAGRTIRQEGGPLQAVPGEPGEQMLSCLAWCTWWLRKWQTEGFAGGVW